MSDSMMRRVKQYFPVSSRSFHSKEVDDAHRYQELLERLDRQGQALAKAQEELDRLESQCKELREIQAFEHESSMTLYWQLMRREGETTEQAQLRFFRGLPKAEGIHKLFQDAEGELFRLFTELCRKESITYWGTGGTVLGAYRQQDFIPWDDDIDVYITRDQLRRLEEVVADDPRFRITDVWDWYVPCKQIRFRLSDPDNPCFIDLFPLDWVAGNPREAWDACTRERHALVERIRRDHQGSDWSRVLYIGDGHPLIPELERVLAEELGDLSEQISVVPTAQGATGLVRGIENIDEVHSSGPYLVDDWLHPVSLPFRRIEVPVPRNYLEYLSRTYGDYMSLPMDMHSHGHVADDYIGKPESVQAMRRLLDPND